LDQLRIRRGATQPSIFDAQGPITFSKTDRAGATAIANGRAQGATRRPVHITGILKNCDKEMTT
jgi:hypothetical protein